jgi:uncharacterized protein with GYD domain
VVVRLSLEKGMSLRELIIATFLGSMLNDTSTPSAYPYQSVSNIPTPSPTPLSSSDVAGHFAISSDYRLIERSICTWDLNELPYNTNLPLLKNISSNQKLCRVMINGYIIFVIGALDNISIIQSAVGVSMPTKYTRAGMFPLNDIVIAAENSPNKLYELSNSGYIGSEVLAYAYDGNIGIFTAQSSLDSNAVISAFKYVLELAAIRKYTKACIVYTGDRENPLIAALIDTVNEQVPVLANLDAAFDYVRKDYFHERHPQLELDASGCPIGKQSMINNIRLAPFKCTKDFAIHGLSMETINFGVKFKVTSTNRRFAIKVSALRSNGTVAKFSMTFGKKGLIVQAEVDSTDIISPLGISAPYNGNNTEATIIEFPYNHFINSESYYVRLKPDLLKFGLYSDAITVEVRKIDERNFKQIGMFIMHGQPRYMQFCGFSPSNRVGVDDAHTTIDEVKSTFINSGLKYKCG